MSLLSKNHQLSNIQSRSVKFILPPAPVGRGRLTHSVLRQPYSVGYVRHITSTGIANSLTTII